MGDKTLDRDLQRRTGEVKCHWDGTILQIEDAITETYVDELLKVTKQAFFCSRECKLKSKNKHPVINNDRRMPKGNYGNRQSLVISRYSLARAIRFIKQKEVISAPEKPTEDDYIKMVEFATDLELKIR